MKESRFIDQNKEKWKSFEEEIKQKGFKPNRVADYYIDTLDDLSFARSHYPNRQVRSYLNGMTRLLSLKIYKTQKGAWKSLINFWKVELPLVMYHNRKQFWLSMAIFWLSFGIGVFSCIQDETFERFILGEGYVNMTLENIESGDPMAVYKDGTQGDMFFRITINNIRVSIMVYLFSFFLGLGTVLIVVYNGIMVGAFQYMFIQRGLGIESALTIWQHGTLEIFSIILSGTAGLVLAKGLLFPGTYSRLDALRLAARQSLVVLMGLIPILVYTGFVESFITRYTDVHWAILGSTIALSVGFIIIYFIWYPYRVAAKHNLDDTFKVNLQPIRSGSFEKHEVQQNIVLAGNALNMIGKNFTVIILPILAIVAGLAYWINTSMNVIPFGSIEHYSSDVSVIDLFTPTLGWRLVIVNVLLFFGGYLGVIYVMERVARPNDRPDWMKRTLRKIPMVLLLSALSAMLISNYWTMVLLLPAIPALGMMLMASIERKTDLFAQLGPFYRMIGSGYFRAALIAVAIAGAFGFAFMFVDEFIGLLYYGWMVLVPQEFLDADVFHGVSSMMLVGVVFSIGLMMCTLASGLVYYAADELTNAQGLNHRLEDLFPNSGSDRRTKKGMLGRQNLKKS